MDWSKVKLLAEFDTPTVANGLELLAAQDPTVGYTGPDIRALTPDMGRQIGIAVTSRLDTTTAGTDRPDSLFFDWLRTIDELVHSCAGEPVPVFAVMEAVGPRPRHTVTIGDCMATQLKLAGCVGFITNGSIRDIDGIMNAKLPCWAAGLSPMHGRLRWLDINQPVVIDGMTVRHGDVIHADVNGAIVIPPATAERVYEMALQVQRKEQELFMQLKTQGLTIR